MLVDGKSRSLRYFARVDNHDDDYEGVFSQKINNRIDSGQATFIVNEYNAASFVIEDIIVKLPLPDMVGGSARSKQKLSNFDFSKLDLAQNCVEFLSIFDFF